MARSPFFRRWQGGVYQADYLTSADQAIPDWLVKILFLGESKL